MLDKAECNHDKSYSPNVLLTYPAKRQWICRKCAVEGVDTDSLPQWNDYDALKRLKSESIIDSNVEQE